VRRGGRGTSGGTSGEATEQNEASGWGSPVSDRDLDRPDKDEGYEDKGEDSKAVRLTLMEEVLLLGIKDREVRRPYCMSSCMSLPGCLCGRKVGKVASQPFMMGKRFQSLTFTCLHKLLALVV
jgi:hypothetical protein